MGFADKLKRLTATMRAPLRRARRPATSRRLAGRRLTLALLTLAILTFAADSGARAATPLWGVTVDSIAQLQGLTSTLSSLPDRPTTRVYFNVAEPPQYYAQAVQQIHGVSGVMGELLDSSEETSISTAAFAARVDSYIGALSSSVDIWEIGNEVNGNWTGPYADVSEKLTEAFDRAAAAGGRTALTLYANNFGPNNCGDGPDELTPTQFGERYVPARVATGLDYVLLSYYPTQCRRREPSSLEVARSMEALHAIFPHAELGFGEVGLPRRVKGRTVGKARQIMSWAYSLNPGLPYYVGGYFWWYGAEDALRPGAPLSSSLSAAFEGEAAALGGHS